MRDQPLAAPGVRQVPLDVHAAALIALGSASTMASRVKALIAAPAGR
jgi:hypothetical protein